jgi:ABC transport system ATP-binding/permease protein
MVAEDPEDPQLSNHDQNSLLSSRFTDLMGPLMDSLASNSMLLSATDLTLVFDYLRLLNGVTLAVTSGEKVGLVGRNGCGKTSLLKILAKQTEADSGELSRRKGLRIGYLPQEFELIETTSVHENILSGASDVQAWIADYESGNGSEANQARLLESIEQADGWHLETRTEMLATRLSTPPLNTQVATLSGGEKRRVALCRALVGQPDLLLLDEPTNHLDTRSINWLENYLKTFKGAVIFVTHDRYFLDTIATRVVELDNGEAFSHPGNYTSYLENKATRQQIADQSERRRQRFLREELQWVRAGVRAQRSKARHRLNHFYEVDGLEAPPEEREMDVLIPPPSALGNIGVELKDAGVQFGEGQEAHWLFRKLNLSLEPGKCIGVVGKNGVGKTTLLRLCMGELKPSEGTVTIGKKLQINYIDQSRMQLEGHGTLLEEIAGGNENIYFGQHQINARGYLRRFQFPEHRANEPVSQLSGGERARLMLAKVLKRGGNCLILDEPTNDLDLPSLRMLEEALADFDGSVIVVSHDRYFLDRICDQIIAFEPQGLFVQPGNYSYYLEKLEEREKYRQPETRTSQQARAAKKPRARKERPRRLSYMEKRELGGMEEAILEAESDVATMEAKLNDPSFYIEHADKARMNTEKLTTLKLRVTRLYERWEELASIENGGS